VEDPSQQPRIEETVSVLRRMFDREDDAGLRSLHVKDTQTLRILIGQSLGTPFWQFLSRLQIYRSNMPAFDAALVPLLEGPARAIRLTYLRVNVFHGVVEEALTPKEYASQCWWHLNSADDDDVEEWVALALRTDVPECAPANLLQQHEWPLPRVWRDKTARFSHGGGLMHIINFLTGQTQGYNLEPPVAHRRQVAQLTGLQVTWCRAPKRRTENGRSTQREAPPTETVLLASSLQCRAAH